MGAAERFLTEHQDIFDEAEDTDRRTPGAHAAQYTCASTSPGSSRSPSSRAREIPHPTTTAYR